MWCKVKTWHLLAHWICLLDEQGLTMFPHRTQIWGLQPKPPKRSNVEEWEPRLPAPATHPHAARHTGWTFGHGLPSHVTGRACPHQALPWLESPSQQTVGAVSTTALAPVVWVSVSPVGLNTCSAARGSVWLSCEPFSKRSLAGGSTPRGANSERL